MRRDQRSTEATAYRRLYKTKRWQLLRYRIFARDPLCGICRKLVIGRFDVDHKVEHKGDLTLFWDEANLQVLHPECHARAKQSEERIGYSNEVGADGWPTDKRHPANMGRGA